MTNTNYLFNLRKISNSNNNKSPVIIYGNTIQTPNNLETLIGPTGAAGDRFATKTPYELILKPSENTILIFKVEPGLAYISGNSVIVAEVGDNINSELNTFEGTIQFYSKKTGEIVIKDIVNIHGEFGVKTCYYYVNLDGVDGAPGEQGPIGPTGPSCISENCNELFLINNTITIPSQENPIAYYKLNLKNNDELQNINCSLKFNQEAIILIKLVFEDYDTLDIASIYQIKNIKNNFTNTIYLTVDSPYAIMNLNKIENNIFCSCRQYFNSYNIKI